MLTCGRAGTDQRPDARQLRPVEKEMGMLLLLQVDLGILNRHLIFLLDLPTPDHRIAKQGDDRRICLA